MIIQYFSWRVNARQTHYITLIEWKLFRNSSLDIIQSFSYPYFDSRINLHNNYLLYIKLLTLRRSNWENTCGARLYVNHQVPPSGLPTSWDLTRFGRDQKLTLPRGRRLIIYIVIFFLKFNSVSPSYLTKWFIVIRSLLFNYLNHTVLFSPEFASGELG